MAAELPELLVADAAGLRDWLKDHHATSDGVRLVLTKKGGTDTTVTWAQAVEELLCYGWIDGQAGKRDEGSYTIRITPRRARSMWSQRNVELVAQLEKQRRMRAAGRAAVDAAKADGRWAAAYSASSVAEVPADLLAAIAAEPEAQRMFDVLDQDQPVRALPPAQRGQEGRDPGAQDPRVRRDAGPARGAVPPEGTARVSCRA